MQNTNLHTQPDAASLALYVAEWLTAQVEAKTAAGTGPFNLSLSGGSTPKALYTLLAKEPFLSRMPWHNLHLFFGDERFVAPTHADSNYRMVKEAMLDHVPLPAANIHAFPILATPEASASTYATTLQNIYGAAELDATRPLFDVTLLGLGEDGHTASLFPNTQALTEHTAWTAAVIGAKPEPRLTLTYPVIASSAKVAFLLAGAGKKEVLQRVWNGDTALPASHVKPHGELLWFTDTAALPAQS